MLVGQGAALDANLAFQVLAHEAAALGRPQVYAGRVRPAARNRAHEPFLLEAKERLADRGPAEPKRLAEVLELEPLTGDEAGIEHRFADALIGGLLEVLWVLLHTGP